MLGDGVVVLGLQDGAELDAGLEEGADFADGFERAVQLWGPGAVAVAEEAVVLAGRPQTSPRHDHRRASCSVTVPQTPPGSPVRRGRRITAEAYHESFLQVKAFWKAMRPRPGSRRYTSPALRHTAPYALVHNNENPR